MKNFNSILLSAIALSLTASVSYAEIEETLPAPPTAEELINLETQFRSPKPQISRYGLFDVFKSECRFSIQVPDPVTRGTIALTFDDGPNPETTPLVLDILKAHNVKATFFVLGGKIHGNENLIRRMIKEGHHVGNHSYSHPNFHLLSGSKARAEITTTDRLIRQFTNPAFLRFPYGFSTCNGKDAASSLGYKIVGWDIDTCDWAYADGQVSSEENKICQTPENLRKDYPGHVLREVNKTQGGVVLMHDIHRNTAQTLDRLISILVQKGYRFVSLDDRNLFAKLNNR